MASPSEEVKELMEKTVREQIDLYRQLIHDVEVPQGRQR